MVLDDPCGRLVRSSRRDILKQIDIDLMAVEEALNRRRQSLAEIDKKLNELQVPLEGSEACPKALSEDAGLCDAAAIGESGSFAAWLAESTLKQRGQKVESLKPAFAQDDVPLDSCGKRVPSSGKPRSMVRSQSWSVAPEISIGSKQNTRCISSPRHGQQALIAQPSMRRCLSRSAISPLHGAESCQSFELSRGGRMPCRALGTASLSRSHSVSLPCQQPVPTIVHAASPPHTSRDVAMLQRKVSQTSLQLPHSGHGAAGFMVLPTQARVTPPLQGTTCALAVVGSSPSLTVGSSVPRPGRTRSLSPMPQHTTPPPPALLAPTTTPTPPPSAASSATLSGLTPGAIMQAPLLFPLQASSQLNTSTGTPSASALLSAPSGTPAASALLSGSAASSNLSQPFVFYKEDDQCDKQLVPVSAVLAHAGPPSLTPIPLQTPSFNIQSSQASQICEPTADPATQFASSLFQSTFSGEAMSRNRSTAELPLPPMPPPHDIKTQPGQLAMVPSPPPPPPPRSKVASVPLAGECSAPAATLGISTRAYPRSFSEVKMGSFAEGLEQWRPPSMGSFQARTESIFAPAAAAGLGGPNATYNGPQAIPRAQPQCPTQ